MSISKTVTTLKSITELETLYNFSITWILDIGKKLYWLEGRNMFRKNLYSKYLLLNVAYEVTVLLVVSYMIEKSVCLCIVCGQK